MLLLEDVRVERREEPAGQDDAAEAGDGLLGGGGEYVYVLIEGEATYVCA